MRLSLQTHCSIQRSILLNSPIGISSVIAASLLLIMSPVFIVNTLMSLCLFSSPFSTAQTKDISGNCLRYVVFKHGIFKHSLMMLLIIKGRLSWIGMPRDLTAEEACYASCFSKQQAGVVSLYGLHRLSGLSVLDLGQDISTQSEFGKTQSVALLLKYTLASVLYSAKALDVKPEFELFDIRIDNMTLDSAVKHITANSDTTKTVCFANVNSFNLAHRNAQLRQDLNATDLVFADGSGARIAAQRKGYRLLDNVNGTDLLPKLCERAIQEGKSIFLLGAKPEVAQKTAENLVKHYPGLNIAGTHHGYFDQKNCSEVIQKINDSHANILLVAFGSPIQENFLQVHKASLKADTAVAVGGLFDFYSGNISRAPMWMRELGLEWIWRLVQEPKAKFNRYVIGNPIFLFRCFTKL